MEKLSKEQVIRIVEGHKDIIRDATDRLSDFICKFRKAHPKDLDLTEEESVEIRKIIHSIISEVSMIGGFCDSWTKNYIAKTVNIVSVSAYTVERKISILSFYMLELWANKINEITPDYNKTPFRLSDLKPLVSILESAFKSLGK